MQSEEEEDFRMKESKGQQGYYAEESESKS